MTNQELQKLGENLRDLVLRAALVRSLLNAGGEMVLFEDDIEAITSKAELSQHQIALVIKEDPIRVIIRLLTPERFEELQD